MKKLIIILFLFCMHISLYCQNLVFKVNCNDSLLMTIKGTYIKGNDVIFPTASVLPKAQQPEVYKRTDAMHKLLLETYPQPLGVDGRWFLKMSAGTFADDVHFSKGIPVCMYSYNCIFCSYTCVQNSPKEVYRCADVYDRFKVFVNQIGDLQNDYMLDTMSINGRKVYMLNPLIGSWKGYDLYSTPGESFKCIILSRKGESPLIPVTRKQYLDYCFFYLNNFYDKMIGQLPSMPVRSPEEQEAKKQKDIVKIETDYKNNPKIKEIILKNFTDTYKTDQQRRDETTQILIRNKDDVIKRYAAELEKTREASLLDAPAEIYSPFTVSEDTPIFASGPDGGKMLVTANPAYIRKDLPKYVPQFIVLNWSWVSDFPNYGGEQGVYYKKIMEAGFPVEKLQDMIDK